MFGSIIIPKLQSFAEQLVVIIAKFTRPVSHVGLPYSTTEVFSFAVLIMVDEGVITNQSGEHF